MTRALSRALARRKVLGYTTDENGIIIDDSIAVAASERAEAARRAGQKRLFDAGARSAPPPNYDSELNPMFEVPALSGMAGTTRMAEAHSTCEKRNHTLLQRGMRSRLVLSHLPALPYC